MPALDDAQQEKFVQNLIKGASKGEAYLTAGYKCKNNNVASAGASRLLKNANVAARYEELQVSKVRDAQLTQADLAAMFIEDRASAREAKQFSAAISAGSQLMKLFGWGSENHKHGGDSDNPIVFEEIRRTIVKADHPNS